MSLSVVQYAPSLIMHMNAIAGVDDYKLEPKCEYHIAGNIGGL